MSENNAYKVVLITGGSKGIGLGISEVLARKGYKLMITGRNQKDLKSSVDHLNKISANNTISMAVDVRKMADLNAAVDATIQKWGRLDVVIANAGVGHFKSIEDLSEKDWNEVIDTNLTGAFFTLKSSLNALKKSKGYYITIASLAGTNYFAKGSAYNASKFGLVGFSQAVMLDLRKFGIKVSTIMPGSVSSYFNDNIPSEADAWKIQPEDIGQIVLDLLAMNPRTLPSKIEVRPSLPPEK